MHAYLQVTIVAFCVLGSLLPVKMFGLMGFSMYAFSVVVLTSIVVLFVIKDHLLGLVVATLFVSVLMKAHVHAVTKLCQRKLSIIEILGGQKNVIMSNPVQASFPPSVQVSVPVSDTPSVQASVPTSVKAIVRTSVKESVPTSVIASVPENQTDEEVLGEYIHDLSFESIGETMTEEIEPEPDVIHNPLGANGVVENPYAMAQFNTYKGTQTLTAWT
jgi:hypothetical protein